MPIETSRQVRPPEEILSAGRGAPESTATLAEEAKRRREAQQAEPKATHIKPLSATVVIDKETFKGMHFVKNTNPHERINFKDKTTFVFPGQLYYCKDYEIAVQILEVADQYGIVVR